MTRYDYIRILSQKWQFIPALIRCYRKFTLIINRKKSFAFDFPTSMIFVRMKFIGGYKKSFVVEIKF